MTKKDSFRLDFGPNSGRQVFFSVTRYHGPLSPCTISEKTNDSILSKLRVISYDTVRLTLSIQKCIAVSVYFGSNEDY